MVDDQAAGDSSESPPLAYESPDELRPAGAAPPEAPRAGRRHDPYAALRLPDFRRYSAGFILSVAGQQMLSVAVGWEIYQRTHSALALGMVGLVQALPIVVLALPAGHLADRVSRRRIVYATQSLTALLSVVLAWLSFSGGPLPVFYAVLLGLAVCRAYDSPARNALLPQLLPVEQFSNAITWNASGFQVASMFGPTFGGFLIAWMQGRHNLTHLAFPCVYLVNAGTALCFAILVRLIRTPARPVAAPAAVSLHALGAGLRFVWQTKIILATITLDLFAVLLGGAVALLPVYARDILHVGATGLGVMRAAPSVGAFAMALVLAHLPPMKQAGKAMLYAVAGFGLATVVFGLSRNFLLSLFMLVLTGACDNISVVVRHTLVQVLTPDAMRGRVSAVNNVFIGASNELGEFESGVTADLFNRLRPGAGATLSVVLGGIGSMVIVALAALVWPQLRRFGSLTRHGAQGAGEEAEAGRKP